MLRVRPNKPAITEIIRVALTFAFIIFTAGFGIICCYKNKSKKKYYHNSSDSSSDSESFDF